VPYSERLLYIPCTLLWKGACACVGKTGVFKTELLSSCVPCAVCCAVLCATRRGTLFAPLMSVVEEVYVLLLCWLLGDRCDRRPGYPATLHAAQRCLPPRLDAWWARGHRPGPAACGDQWRPVATSGCLAPSRTLVLILIRVFANIPRVLFPEGEARPATHHLRLATSWFHFAGGTPVCPPAQIRSAPEWSALLRTAPYIA
jgi:hypothetical protein